MKILNSSFGFAPVLGENISLEQILGCTIGQVQYNSSTGLYVTGQISTIITCRKWSNTIYTPDELF